MTQNISDLSKLFRLPKDLEYNLFKIKENFNFNIEIKNEDSQQPIYDNYNIEFQNDVVKIVSANYRSFIYALDDFMLSYKKKDNVVKKTTVLNRGYMLDISRGKIPNKKFMYELVIFLRKNKINNLQIYVEPNFKDGNVIWIKGFDEKNIAWLNKLCEINNIVLIPAIASFSHLYDLVKSDQEIQKLSCIPFEDREYFFADKMRHYTLDPTQSETFNISKMIIDFALKNFKSKIINIGCDEPFDMQTEYYKERHPNYFEIYTNYIKKLTDYVIAQDWTPQIWADVFVNNKGKEYFGLDKRVIFLNWDYNPLADVDVANAIDNNYKQILCSSDGNFGYQYTNLQKGFLNQNTLVKYNNQLENVNGVMLTHWGDWGHLNSSVHGLLIVKHLYKQCYEFDNKLIEYSNATEIIYDSLVENQLLLYRRLLSWYEWKLLWPEYKKYEEERNDVMLSISSYKPYISIVQTNAKTNWLLKNKSRINWLPKFFKKIFFEELELFREINIINNMIVVLVQKNIYNMNHGIVQFTILDIKNKLDEFYINVIKNFDKYYKYNGIQFLLKKYYEVLNLIVENEKQKDSND